MVVRLKMPVGQKFSQNLGCSSSDISSTRKQTFVPFRTILTPENVAVSETFSRKLFISDCRAFSSF